MNKGDDGNVKQLKINYEPKLHKSELLLYFLGWFMVLFSGCWIVYKNAHNKLSRKHFIDEGYLEKDFLGFYQNTGEYMFSEIEALVFKGTPYFVMYFVVSRVARKFGGPTSFMLTCTALSLAFQLYQSSWKFMLYETSIYASMLMCGLTRSKLLVWISGVAWLYNINRFFYMDFLQLQSDFIMNQSFSYVALLVTRAISVGLLVAEDGLKLSNVIETSYFYWYFPAIIGCRMMTIRDFIQQIYRPYQITNWPQWSWSVFKVALAICIWYVVMYLVPYSMVLTHFDLKYVDAPFATGGQLFYGIHFYMVYYIMYNAVYLLCQLDGFETTPGPICICRVSLFSTLWRDFDRGLHVWIKDHIYRPIMKFGNGSTVYRFLGAIPAFGFVFLFHGINIHNSAFIILNLLQFYVEILIKQMYGCQAIRDKLHKFMSPACIHRIIGALCGISFIFSIFGFACMQHGKVLALDLYSSFINGVPNQYYHRLLLFLGFCYIHGQVSYHVNSVSIR